MSVPGSAFKFYWQPSLSIDAGEVSDAGGNEKLQAIRDSGRYVRLAPSVAFKLTIPRTNDKFSLALSHTQRFDLTESWNRGMTTGSFQYDLTNNVAFTVVRRHGRKPPDFAAVDDVLIGIGLKQVLP